MDIYSKNNSPEDDLNLFEDRFRNTGYNGEFGEYNVKNFTYPTGLGVNLDLQHYITFYINVRGKSTFDMDNRMEKPVETAGQNRIDPRDAGKALPFVAGGLAGLAVAGKSILGATKNPRNIGKAVVKGAAAAAGVGVLTKALQSTPLLKPDTTYRLKDVITLHLDERPSVKYSANYQNKELGVLAGMLSGGGSATDSSSGLSSSVTEYLALAGAMASKIPGVVGATTLNNLVQASAKVTTNPFREVFFESVDFRTFNFRYKFFPKNQIEVENVKNIIDKFKAHMHPELSANGLFYIYPSEFEIQYFYQGQENSYFNRISTCALTDLQVEYGGETFSSFDNGEPVEVYLTLTFRELETLTRQRVEQGGY